jgi:virulence factor
VEALLASGVTAAFVHAATEAHANIIAALLRAGCHVYVDKPLDDSHAGAAALAELARESGRSLMVGFNRRYAPAYAALRAEPRDVIVLQKNRANAPGRPRAVIFDDFIHVVDTLRFLAPAPVEQADVRARVRDGLLHHVVLQLSGDGFTAIGAMNRLSGSAEEILEVSGQDTKREVRNLAEVVDHKGQPSVRRRGDWVPVARQRGIEQVMLVFLDAVRAGEVLSARDALATHELCERIVREVGRAG